MKLYTILNHMPYDSLMMPGQTLFADVWRKMYVEPQPVPSVRLTGCRLRGKKTNKGKIIANVMEVVWLIRSFVCSRVFPWKAVPSFLLPLAAIFGGVNVPHWCLASLDQQQQRKGGGGGGAGWRGKPLGTQKMLPFNNNVATKLTEGKPSWQHLKQPWVCLFIVGEKKNSLIEATQDVHQAFPEIKQLATTRWIVTVTATVTKDFLL